MSEYDSRQFVGIDLHRRRSVIVRTTDAGQALEVARITNDVESLQSVLARAGEAPQVVLEATYGWYWAADALEQSGAVVHLAHPLGVKMFEVRRVKNDVKDATDLADLLRMGRLPEAWIAPPAVRELRELVRHRAKLVGLRTNLKCQVHAVLASAGIAVPMSDLFGVEGNALLDRVVLPQAMRVKVISCRSLIGVLDVEIDRFAKLATARLHADPGYTATDFNQHRGTQTLEQGARSAVRLATLPADGPTGGFFAEEARSPGELTRARNGETTREPTHSVCRGGGS